eukprot:gene21676-33364_t
MVAFEDGSDRAPTAENGGFADEELWEWLYCVNAEYSWHAGLCSKMDRVRVLYAAVCMDQANTRSTMLDNLFCVRHCKTESFEDLLISDDYPRVNWGSKAMLPPPSSPPDLLTKYPAPSSQIPYLLSDQVKPSKNKKIAKHNEEMARIREYRARNYTNDQLVEIVVRPCTVGRELSFIEEAFFVGGDIMMGSIERVPLICPYSSLRLKIPARGASCKHLATFDLHSWAYQVMKPSCPATYWKCPICSQTLYLGSVYISPFILHILE